MSAERYQQANITESKPRGKRERQGGALTALQESRSAGVLMHISSLPNDYGIGTMGDAAYDWVDLLASCGVKYWQVLPLVQTSYGDSPYQSPYSGSGNPYLIDMMVLVKQGLLQESQLADCLHESTEVDYARLYEKKYVVLRRAYERFDVDDEAFVAFEREGLFEGYALFMAIKQMCGGQSFDQWPPVYKFRDAASIERFKAEHLKEVRFWLFLQYEFQRQWTAIKRYANAHGVQIIGDLPLYVAYDSADVWLNPHLFRLNTDLSPKKVAGVPPDYFSATGQLWGNPVYRWGAHRSEHYHWWIDRLRHALTLYDVVRLDHFRGFDRYYEIGAKADTAVRGMWKHGPRQRLFQAAEAALGRMNIIAEDLGALDEGVYQLMRATGYPGMKVLQFAFDGNPNNPHLPQNFDENAVCYTGTHDNDTMCGYLKSLNQEAFAACRTALLDALVHAELNEQADAISSAHGKNAHAGLSGVESAAETDEARAKEEEIETMTRAVVALALKSRAALAVAPIQDILQLRSDARMNTPSTTGGNWKFRLSKLPTIEDLEVFCGELKLFDRQAQA